MRINVLLVAALISTKLCFGQQPVAPTTEPVGPARGGDWHEYNFVNSFETGYRFESVAGNIQQYRATENFGNGVRLLQSFLSINSRDGHGGLFDQVVLSTLGLGGDPYQSASLRIQKNRSYEYDLLWRQNDYVNPGLTTAGGRGDHALNTSYTLQDHNLTLFPQSPVRFSLGYSSNRQSGAGVSTVQLFNVQGQFDNTGHIFPLFTNVKRTQNEFRLGGDIVWFGFTLNWMRGWEDYRDDSPYVFTGPPTNNANSLTSFTRTQPDHGTTPYWIAALFRNFPRGSINARFTYRGAVRTFITNENAIGINQLSASASQQIISSGDARRPMGTGNVNVSLFPTQKLTVVNQTSVYSVRTSGDSAYVQVNDATRSADVAYYQYLGIRTLSTATDAKYQLRPWLDFHGGYQYSNRRITSTQQFAVAGTASALPYYQTNALNSGNFGLHITAFKHLNIVVDDEMGRSSRPFTPKGDKNYNVFVGRIDYKLKTLQIRATSQSDYNNNSVTVTAYSSHGRTYSASTSWTPRSWFSFDAAYSKTHLQTLGGIAFFAESQLFANQVSYYISNLHAGLLSARFGFKRADLYVGYSRIEDTGDGRTTPTSTSVGPTFAAFQSAQTFPLKWQSPLARLSIRVSERVRWNVGYQYFGYHASFSSNENYLANTGYTSLLWSF